jgi:hypothetical protein
VPGPVVLPEFEPTLPALVRRRTGLRERTTVALLALAVALLVVAVVLVRPRVDELSQLVYRGTPQFNLLYAHDAVRSVDPRPGELARLEGGRGRQAVEITVRPLQLPAHDGDVAHGLLPVYASGHVRELAARLDRFRLLDEHRTRINQAPGYEMRFRTGPVGRRTFGTDLLVVEDEQEERGAVLLGIRRRIEGRVRLGKSEKRFADLATEAFRSFHYGTGRG